MSTPLPFAPMLSIPVLPRGPKLVGIDDLTMGTGVDTFGALFAMFAAQTPMVSPNPTLDEATVNLPGLLTATDDPAKTGATVQQSTQPQPTILPPDPLGLIAMADKMTMRDVTQDLRTEQLAQTTKSGIPVNTLIVVSSFMPEATTLPLETSTLAEPLASDVMVHPQEPLQAAPTVTVRHDGTLADQVIPRVVVAEPDRWSNLARNLNILNIDVTTNRTPAELNMLRAADRYTTPLGPTSPAAQPISNPVLVLEQVAAENRTAALGNRKETIERKSEILTTIADPAEPTRNEVQTGSTPAIMPGKQSVTVGIPSPNQGTSTVDKPTVMNDHQENKPEMANTADTPLDSTQQGTVSTDALSVTVESTGKATVVGLDSTEPDRQLPQVRFTLPEKLAVPNNGRSHTVTISLEPEHLGPARLHLSSHNDLVSARLTVDTPEAKAVVNGSLDRLVEQLHKAGVRVQQVDVQVRGDLLPGHSQHQQTFWRRGFGGRSRTLSPLTATESAAARPLSMLLTPQVMTAGQLNLYA